MTKEELTGLFMEAVNIIRTLAPKDTGNLAYNAIKYKWINETDFVIYVDMGEAGLSAKRTIGIAPYMPFTNEKWINRNGKVNPNEGWWGQAAEYVAYYIAGRLFGEIRK